MTAQKQTILFLGRNTEGIMRDAQAAGLLFNPIVLTRRNDSLPVPEGVPAMAADEFVPESGTEYILIANGGTTQQSFPTFGKLLTAAIPVEVYDLQRDGITKVWPL